ncbi:DEAD/DEAH box helicase [Candidatus Desantisbacteria bacterium]|nr:DEAD/DEAH box helicase [Candidatus Desantisbacteria bacterium]
MDSQLNKNENSKNLKPKPIKLKVPRAYKPEDITLEEWQILLRKQFSQEQKYSLKNIGEHSIFSEFLLTNPLSKKTYKIAIRSNTPGDNFCSCPDFSINNLGTCKHIEFVLHKLMKRKDAKKAFEKGYALPYSEVYLSYGLKREVKFKKGKEASPELLTLAANFFDSNGILKNDWIPNFNQFLNNIPQNTGQEVRCYDDVMSYIAEHQDALYRRNIVLSQFKEGIKSPIFKNILKTELYPYQLEGAMFAVKAGRCLIGDDMGLGKTIQALTATELLFKLFNIQKVLIISPTSLKHQWKSEIEKFTSRNAIVVEGMNTKRKELYHEESFYKLINYELVSRDVNLIKEWSPDLIILDEAQRIKNWKTRTAQYVKQLESNFAIVLTGTPIENRIEELHSIMEFIDRHKLGPLYKFVHNYRIIDDGGKVIGYQNLQSIRDSLSNILIRRKKNEVLKQLPGRLDKNFFVPMTKEQREIHDENYDIVARLVTKWRRYKFLCEADQRRMQIALNFMRMASDNTYLVDKKTIHGPKIEELEIILKEIVIEGKEKCVIFSQWLRMTELVEQILKRNDIKYAHLNGSIPSHKRKDLISQFKEDPACMVFLSTDAGGVGLNLQSGSVVINMDIPWNPAVLEQRIGRVHRLGQQKAVRVINFVTSNSIEEKILGLLNFKKSLFSGAMDSDGENIVMLGDSQLKKIMQTVETLTENLEKADPEVEKQIEIEEKIDKEKIVKDETTLADDDTPVDTKNIYEEHQAVLNNFLKSGAEFLMNMSKIVSEPKEQMSAHLNTMIGKDETTGKEYLKIPLPDRETIKNAFSALGELISNIIQK